VNSFVVDENFDDKRVIRACDAEGRCQVRRCPPHLKGKKDYEVLPELLSGTATLVTLDATIVEENIQHIPNENPGIVVIRLLRPSQAMTTTLASRLLKEFKTRCPSWADMDLAGVCLEITETDLFVSRLRDREPGERIIVPYVSARFNAEAAAAIQKVVAVDV
jgi:hypothetical protein